MEQNENAREMPSDAVQDEILASILQKIGSVGKSASTPADDGKNSSQNVISSLLSNPELIAKLPTILSSVKPIIEMLGKMGTSANTVPVATVSDDTAKASNNAAAAVSATTKEVSGAHKGADSRTALLCAIKPYLSDSRREAVDYIIKLSRLGEILKTL